MQITKAIIQVVIDLFSLLSLLLRSRGRLAAENLFLRKQLAYYQERGIRPRRLDPADLPPIVVPLPMRVLEPWPEGEAERSPEAMVHSFQVPGADSPVNCAA